MLKRAAASVGECDDASTLNTGDLRKKRSLGSSEKMITDCGTKKKYTVVLEQ
jgi:hypothetical protein